MKVFPRKVLAESLVQPLSGKVTLSDAPNGMFLFAPRGTGKSTFLQRDLIPALQRIGATPIYVDLWADKARDPALLIQEAIGRTIDQSQTMTARLAKKAGLASVGIAGVVNIDTRKIGKPDGSTLPDALRALRDITNRPVALIIDEAQQALVSQAGETAMTALKSARDQLNKPGMTNLMLNMSGSDRDKLLRLVKSCQAPFFGSQIDQLPLLGRDYVEHICAVISTQRKGEKPDTSILVKAFELFGNRPQLFNNAVSEALSALEGAAAQFEQTVLAAAQSHWRDEALAVDDPSKSLSE